MLSLYLLQVNGSLGEGATALRSSIQKYGAENLNHITASPRQRHAMQKVPENLLMPTPETNPSVKSRYAECDYGSHLVPGKKIMNDRLPG